MERLDYMVIIVGKGIADDYLNLIQKQGVLFALKTTGNGTATDEVRKYLGLDNEEKRVLFTTMTHKKAKRILSLFDGESQLNRPGAGIAFTIPISSIAGNQALQLFTGKTASEEEKEEIKLKAQTEHELIMAVATRGYVDTVMDSARKAGVQGGTVIHALGTKLDPNERQFYGISVGRERELIIMLVKSDIKDAAMKQITDEAGLHTPAQCMVLSLPVNGVAGIS